MTLELLAFEGVACVRGGRTLFEGLSFALAPGEALLVTGANGAGKSSLVRIAAGLLQPAAGTVRRGLLPALLAEQAALDPELPLAEALAYWMGIDGRGGVAEARLALGWFQLAHLAEVAVRYLSTGQRRRAGLARVFAAGKPLWLLDEPANGLDAESVRVLEARLMQHRAAGGAALVATHLPIALPDAREIAL
ncbi:heme ABC exporter ATP-binding protein CcmA [Sphingomonas sp.]|uniref:heme ABC exporter ATP-binding protein CcmA n=1 Tax=Sphingomonas sp. TaxID=28214 RepID=UPI001B0C6D91|nr:heme ABC exporter ATP-binding protein CcmA [Sphingomonas sp.]MBO9712993.1 heme ABC exporter ATP-binding protein CcmA [Sphingomonas sp.]